ncbi:MAG: bifunctional methylenetetrahydrofolate dehydrogenase/methenyltetrahydrofolate cyclohydrolase FolD [Candidatus Bipolaricaulia bacterium]
MGEIIDGKQVAESIRSELSREIEGLQNQHGVTPGLAAVLVGEDPASHVYVRMKEKACAKVGIRSQKIEKPADISQDELLGLIHELNEDDEVHGILVQLPLPDHIDQDVILNAVDTDKDVDGFHPMNLGALMSAKRWDELPRFIPCTPAGCIELIESTGTDIEGKNAVVIGRSVIVGKPVAMLLLAKQATVSICHSRTKDLAAATRDADILVVAAGKTGLITGDMVKDGAVVIDVGTNRVDADNEKGYVLKGDVDFDDAKDVAGHISPVPGGVGPMTITMLLNNTVTSARASVG